MRNLILFLTLFCVFGAQSFAQSKTTGGAKGTVKTPDGKSVAGAAVEARLDGKTAATARTDGKGNFNLFDLKPGVYVFVFTKQGLSEGVSNPLEIKADTVTTLKRLILTVDKGSLAIVRGSVFDHEGRIARRVKVEILRVTGDGSKKIAEKFTDINGEFGISLPPAAARYRFTVKTEDGAATVKDLDVDGAEVYRFAVSLKPEKE